MGAIINEFAHGFRRLHKRRTSTTHVIAKKDPRELHTAVIGFLIGKPDILVN